MKVIFFTIVLVLTISVIDTNTYFQKVGWISPSPSYGHVHMSVNISLLETHIQTLLSTLNILHAETMQHHRPHAKFRGHNFLIKTISELKLLKLKFNDYQKMTNLSPIETRRAKRFLGIILALTSLSIGLYNTAEIIQLKASLSDVVTRQHHITDILQEHEVSIHNIAHNVDEMKLQLKRAVGVVEEIDAKQAFMEMEVEVTKAMTEVHRMVDCLILGTERLLMHRLPLCFTNVANLETAHTRLALDARQRGLTPVQPHITAYLEYETSFIIEHKILHIFVHVPLSDKNQHLELLRFYSIRIPISPTLQMQIDVLFNTNAETLHDVIRSLDMIDSKPLPIREIKKMIWMNNHNKINFGISISIAVISIIIVIFVTFIIYRAYKVKQNSVQEPNNQV